MAIDYNQTLDMYVTVSRDGTVAVRCMQTSRLWYQFRIFYNAQKHKGEVSFVYGFHQNFKHIEAVKLSLHGYIVLIGQTPDSKQQNKFLVYNLSGDTLLHQSCERATIKNVFLNATEDQLIVAQNFLNKELMGHIRVFKLYGLQKVQNLGDVWVHSIKQILLEQQQSQQTI